jgi:hypothetical protein
VAPECVFESPQRENLGSEPFSTRRVAIAEKPLGGGHGEEETKTRCQWCKAPRLGQKSRQLVRRILPPLLSNVKRQWLRRMQ